MSKENLDNVFELYHPIMDYVNSNNTISYTQLNNDAVSKFNLFASIDTINFSELEEKIDLITDTIPSIKRIFAKPIIHLIENDEILPVEAVRTINNKTIQYAASHSENWADITSKGIKPLKLLSKNYVDNYSIYENVVFARAIDYILSFTRTYNHLLKDLIETNQKLEFNLLEKENHLLYFLALGKLQTGYIRSFSKYINQAQRCIEKLDYIENVVSARLNRPVYRRNKKFKGNLNLHKTNILSMQKDYRKIYSFMKKFYTENDEEYVPTSNDKQSYFYFIELLLIFAAGHFNFKNTLNADIKLLDLDYIFSFKDYKLKIQKVRINDFDAIELSFLKEIEYKILLTPFEKVTSKDYDEVIELSPFENLDGTLFVSINQIESFRRLQQVILRGMIMSDRKFDTCPFCGEPLVKIKDSDDDYLCKNCKEWIHRETCSETFRRFSVSRIYKYKNLTLRKIRDTADPWVKQRLVESQLHFRNITPLNEDGDELCPYCNKVHDKNKFIEI